MDALEVREILLNKHCNGLQNPNKKQRKIALENIKKELLGNESDEKTIAQLFKTIQKHLIRCIRDDSEACREYVISLITQIIEKIPKDTSILSLLFPELRERLASAEIKEPSEEVRLLIVILLHTIVLKYGRSLLPYLNDYIEILKKTIVDPYPKVKKESCECAADLSKAIPRDFHMQSESLIKPMVQAMNHQHYRIRVTVIKSLGDVILNGNNKSIETVSTPFAERLFDQNAMVRKAIAEVVGMWMLKLCDRYSYWHKLLPLMLTCLSDEILSQAEEAWKLWDAVGKQWALENEDDLKDKMDFLPEQTTWYPNGVRRPNLGCRELVQRQMSKYLPAIANELTDWKVDIRVKSAQLLCITIQHAESRITQEITKVLSAMYKAFCDEDQRVVENIERSAELIGYFVPMKVYCGQILPVLEDGANAGNLGVFACAIKYSPKEDVSSKIADIVEVLDESGIYYSNKANEQRQLLNVLSSLINNSTYESVNVATQQLFIMLVSVQSITDDEKLRNESKELLTHLHTNNVDIRDMDELSKQCTRSFLQRIESTVPHWTLHNPQLYVFQFILKELEFGVTSSLDIVFKMLKDSMGESVDPEVVLKILWSIFELLQNEKLISVLENKNYFFETILTDILPKQLVWRAGRSAEALRTAAAACLNQGLFNLTKLTSVEISCGVFDLFLPHLLSLVEDSVIKTRLYSLESLQTLIQGAKSAETLTVEHCDKLVPVVMKRLDDVSDTVRITSLKVIQTIYKEPTVICGDHVIAVLHNTLLIHLDDPVKDTRKIVLDTLKDIGKTNPTSLLSKIAIESFRDKDVCIKLVNFLKEEISNQNQ